MVTLCECGCGQKIPAKDMFRYRRPYILRGHKNPSRICACGCGEELPNEGWTRYSTATYKRGHATRNTIPDPRQCACGCGQETTIRKGHNLTYVNGHNSKGVKRGPGRFISDGYVFLLVGPNKYRAEHRIVIEAHIGRSLSKDEAVHHINQDRSDNRLENLEVLSRSEHGKRHGRPPGSSQKSYTHTDEQKAKQSERMKDWWADRKAAQG